MLNKLIENERVFQGINKRTTAQTAGLAPNSIPSDFVMELYCECANKACHERVDITREQYAEGVKTPKTFAVKPEHYLPEFEQVLQKTPNYWIIAKRPEKLDKPFEV